MFENVEYFVSDIARMITILITTVIQIPYLIFLIIPTWIRQAYVYRTSIVVHHKGWLLLSGLHEPITIQSKLTFSGIGVIRAF